MRIAIVNDLRLAVEAIRRALAADGAHVIAWTAADGAEAVAKCGADTPDLILMDMVMPVLDGVEATRRIMAATPCPILVVTATMQGNSSRVFDALGAGALDAVQTPEGATGAAMLRAKIDFLERRILGMREGAAAAVAAESAVKPVAPRGAAAAAHAEFLVVIGASSGGPAALIELLSELPADFPAAVVVVQHIDAQFTRGLVEWLGSRCRLPVKAAVAGERLAAGEVRVAAGERHLILDGDRLAQTDRPAGHIYLPSIDVFFDSVARQWTRPGAAVLLTGMGRDGAAGMARLRAAGFATIAQDRASCAVYGMPKAAAESGAAREVLPLGTIAGRLRQLCSQGAARLA